MQVKNLDAWAGLDHAYSAGEIIDLPDATALARIEAGLAEAIEQPVAQAEAPIKAKRKSAAYDSDD